MKLLFILWLTAVVTAAPPSKNRFAPDDDDVRIIRYENDNIGLPSYQYGFEQSDGTRQDQRGVLRNEGREDESLAVQGSFSWIGPDRVTYTVTYTADAENGYKPEIEQGPGGGVPPAVVASLLG